MKGSAITGPVGKEAAELWPVSTISPTFGRLLRNANIFGAAYRLQLWCCDVSGCLLRETVHMGGVRAAFHAQASSMISCLKTHPLNEFLQPKTIVTFFENPEKYYRIRHLRTRHPNFKSEQQATIVCSFTARQCDLDYLNDINHLGFVDSVLVCAKGLP